MKNLAFIAIVTMVVGCELKSPSESNGIQPNLRLGVPSCRVLDIGGCPYLWCATYDGSQRSTSGLATMSPTCEAQSAVVSTKKAP